MCLQSYLDQNKISDEEFGALIGVTATSVYRYRKGHRKPDDEIMQKIFSITSGAVDANGFYKLKRKRARTHKHSEISVNQ